MKGNSVKIQMIKEYIMKIGILGMLILAGIGFYRGGIDRGVPDREGSYDPSGHIQGRPPGVEPGT